MSWSSRNVDKLSKQLYQIAFRQYVKLSLMSSRKRESNLIGITLCKQFVNRITNHDFSTDSLIRYRCIATLNKVSRYFCIHLIFLERNDCTFIIKYWVDLHSPRETYKLYRSYIANWTHIKYIRRKI